jgi:hypothetical protein
MGGGLVSASTVAAGASKIDLLGGNYKTFGQMENVLNGAFGRAVDVKNLAALFANKVGVLSFVGTIAGGLAVKIDLLNQTAPNQRVEAVVNCCQGDVWHPFFCAQEKLRRGRVIPLHQKRIKNYASLSCKSKPAVADLLLVAPDFFARDFHDHGKISRLLIEIKNYSN